MATQHSPLAKHATPQKAIPTGCSPTPWSVSEARTGYIVECAGGQPGTTATVAAIHETSVRLDQPERAEGDAALIVRAVNNHARLLAHLKTLVDGIASGAIIPADGAAVNAAREAIAAVESEVSK